MTDACEIINAACCRANQWRDQTYASAVVNALTAAGFRILGKDEVDPVTVERCIAAVEAAAPAETEEWNVHRAWVLRGVDAIRAIGRKA